MAELKGITSFRGKYDFLSNFHSCPVEFQGIQFKSAEAAFQASKLENVKDREAFSNYDAAFAKKRGKKVKLRSDWNEVKNDVMLEIVYNKFTQNPELLKLLKETGEVPLTEGNNWHDNYWGVCSCYKCKDKHGKNLLGQILMEIRAFVKGK